MQTQDIDKRQPWFRAKKYGWGWSWPLRWQGWLVIAVYCALSTFGAWRFTHTHDLALVPAFALITLLLLGICWKTGERPRWRWGNDD
jgi:hypothetical protein